MNQIKYKFRRQNQSKRFSKLPEPTPNDHEPSQHMARQRTSSPKPNVNESNYQKYLNNLTSYDKFCLNLYEPFSKQRVRGTDIALNGIISGHLIRDLELELVDEPRIRTNPSMTESQVMKKFNSLVKKNLQTFLEKHIGKFHNKNNNLFDEDCNYCVIDDMENGT